MSKPILNLQMMGRFGNMAMQYLAARAIAERDGLELRTPRWIGEKIFQIEPTAEPDYSSGFICSYFMSQPEICYTLTQVRKWFSFQGWVEERLKPLSGVDIAAHIRRGDFETEGYCIPTLDSYYKACRQHGLNESSMCFVTEYSPTHIIGMPKGAEMIPDFFILAKARTLLRANSSFSFVAAMINTGTIYSPVTIPIPGYCDLEFVKGNYPSISEIHDCCTDLHIPS